MPAASLLDVITGCPLQLEPLWATAVLKTHCTTFYTALLSTFPEDQASGHPCANWVAIIAAHTQQMSLETPPGPPSGRLPYTEYDQIVDDIVRFAMCASALRNQTPAQITAAQATAIVTAYNLAFP